jgi:DNA invertase Pin-like site-specific DNA recombinase
MSGAQYGMIYGYARVSTPGQKVDPQVEQLRAAGAIQIYREAQSGAKTDRVQLHRVLAKLVENDVFMITRLDRFARSTRDLLNMVELISAKGAGIRSLGDPWFDTTTPHGRLMLTVFAGIAEFERALIRARTSEGRTRAKANGVKFGLRLSAGSKAMACVILRGISTSRTARFHDLGRNLIDGSSRVFSITRTPWR